MGRISNHTHTMKKWVLGSLRYCAYQWKKYKYFYEIIGKYVYVVLKLKEWNYDRKFYHYVFSCITILKSLVKFSLHKALICDTFLIPQNWAVILYLQISFLQKQFNFFTHVIPGILCLEFLLYTIFFKLYCHVLNGLLKQELLNSRH